MARKKASRKKARRTTARKTTRKATRKATRKTTRKKASATRSAKITASKTPRTKGDFFRTIAENTDLTRKQVADVFDVAGKIIEKDLSRTGAGVCNFGGLMKVLVQRKKAVPKRKGINPFTGVEQWFKAKPARNVVKVRPLKALKEMV